MYCRSRLAATALAALLALSLLPVADVAAQREPGSSPDPAVTIEVSLWRSVSNPALLYLRTRAEGGRWRVNYSRLTLSRQSASGRFHRSSPVRLMVWLPDADAVKIDVTVWRSVADPSLLYLSTRPEGGDWTTWDTALDMSQVSRSGRFHEGSAVVVQAPLAGATPTPVATPTPDARATPTTARPGKPANLRASKIDLPYEPDDIRVRWSPVPRALWYEVWHKGGESGEWSLKMRVTESTFLDTRPNWLGTDFYKVKACNAAGCSAFSATVRH